MKDRAYGSRWEQGLPPNREYIPSEEDEGRTRIRKSRKGEKSSSPTGSPSDPRSADQQLDDELRKAQRKAGAQMNEAAEQLDENNSLKKECASLQSAINELESDEAGSLQRILGLERMNRALESQVAHVHGRIRDEYNLAMDQLNIKSNRLNEVEAVAVRF